MCRTEKIERCRQWFVVWIDVEQDDVAVLLDEAQVSSIGLKVDFAQPDALAFCQCVYHSWSLPSMASMVRVIY